MTLGTTEQLTEVGFDSHPRKLVVVYVKKGYGQAWLSSHKRRLGVQTATGTTSMGVSAGSEAESRGLAVLQISF